MMQRLILAVLLASGLSTPAAGESPTQLYGYGISLQQSRTAAFYQLELPQAVYGAVVYEDLRDLRVLNAGGEEVPVWLQDAEVRDRSEARQQPLPLFTLDATRADGEPGARIHVVTGRDGTIVDIGDQQAASDGSGPVYYIIDGSKVEGRLLSLRLAWEQPPIGRILAFTVAYSNDLHNWLPLDEVSLSYLESAGQQLYQEEIPLPAFSGSYLRLTPQESLPQRLSGINATISSSPAQTRATNRLRLNAMPAEDGVEAALHFDAGAALPVAALNIDLQQENAVVDYRIEARRLQTDEWHPLGTKSFYHYSIEDKQTRNRDHPVAQGMWRYFRLQPEQQNGSAPAPILELAWRPHRLIFMAQGEGPYRLVYGRGDSSVQEQTLAPLLNRLSAEEQQQAIATVDTGLPQILCGRPCLELPAETVNYTKYLLWLVIVLGSVLVGWMVVRLSGEMKVG
ncbi:MAG: DUF3999 domain-containing protein [Gammaproteobacteria bacterium]|nr:DUF3999 domain-containing protein [Gammaproteobacteria bacterium]